jgi:acetyl esterase/lipase
VPIGYLVTTGLMAVLTLFALAPRRRRQASRSNLSYWLGLLVNELPFVSFAWLAASTALAFGQDDVDSTVGWIAFGLAILATVGLVLVARRALQTGPTVDRALSDGLGSEWRTQLDPPMAGRLRRRLPWGHIVLAPFFFRRRDVERLSNIRYGDAGSRNLLDVYRHRARPSGAPVLVHLHGGAFRSGRKSRQARPLIYRLASQGWVCISANYRIGSAATFPDHVIDAKKLIAWVREHGPEYGADPTIVFLAGTSAGGHLAALAALTPSDPAFQPGFEDQDTAVTAAICLGTYYGNIDTESVLPSSPSAYVRPAAPPFFIAHGELDTLVPVADARRFAQSLRSSTHNPVVYAELPGAQHTFDLFHSIRFETVVDAIEAFTTWVRSRQLHA